MPLPRMVRPFRGDSQGWHEDTLSGQFMPEHDKKIRSHQFLPFRPPVGSLTVGGLRQLQRMARHHGQRICIVPWGIGIRVIEIHP